MSSGEEYSCDLSTSQLTQSQVPDLSPPVLHASLQQTPIVYRVLPCRFLRGVHARGWYPASKPTDHGIAVETVLRNSSA